MNYREELIKVYEFLQELQYHVDSPRTTSDMIYDEVERIRTEVLLGE